MLASLKTIARLLILLVPFGVWALLYLAYKSEYEHRLVYTAEAILLSCLSPLLVWYLQKQYQLPKGLRLFSLCLGSPLTFVLVWAYLHFLALSFQYTEYGATNSQHYGISKYQNIFKAKYLYTTQDKDTLMIVVNRKNKTQKMAYLRQGQEIPVNNQELTDKETLKELKLFQYNRR